MSSFYSTLILLLTFATGFSGLVYEVTWQAYIANLIGSHARSAALIVSVFLGGLSFGYYYFGGISQRFGAPGLIKIYGFAELAIGVWALFFPKLFKIISSNAPLLPTFPDLSGDLLTAIVLIGPPTFLMGGTLPLLTQALSRSIGDSARLHARIYALNTIGAFFGCICAGFILIPHFGLPVTMLLMASINLAAGACMVIFAKDSSQIDNPFLNELSSPELPNASRLSADRLVILLVSCTSGFISISCQMAVIRLIGLSAGSSSYAFSMAVGAFIMLLAFGAWRLSGRESQPVSLWKNQLLLIVGLLLILFTVPTWPYACHVMRVLLTTVPVNFYIFHFLLFAALTMVLLTAVAAMGNTLPTLFRLSQTDLRSLGGVVGKLYAFNTVGCILGALLGGYLFLYLIDFFAVITLLTVIAIIVLALIGWYLEPDRRLKCLCSGLACGSALLLIKAWPAERMGVGTFRVTSPLATSFSGPSAFYKSFVTAQEILAYKDDPNTTVAVRGSLNGHKSIYINGKSDGSTAGGGDRMTTKMLAHLPLLLQKAEPQRVAIIGFGTGITTGTVALYPSVQRVDLIEIAQVLKKLGPLFDNVNGAATKSEKLVWHSEDAFRFLTRNAAREPKYDTIISEPSNPWVTGVERLYAEDFYAIVRQRLEPSGIYAQWFHTYSISPATLGLVLNTFHRAWPQVRMFLFNHDLVLLGSQYPLDENIIPWLRSKSSVSPIKQDLLTLGITQIESLANYEVVAARASFNDAGIQTLEYPKLSYLAGYDFFLGSTSSISSFSQDLRWQDETWQLERKSLLRLLAESRSEGKPLKQMLQYSCNFSGDKIPENWKNYTLPCQRLFIAAIFLGELAETSPELSANINMIRNTQHNSSTAPPADLKQAAELVKFAVTYRSAWLPLNIANILIHTQSCIDNTQAAAAECRLNIAQLLVIQGNNAQAQKILRSIEVSALPNQVRKTYLELKG